MNQAQAYRKLLIEMRSESQTKHLSLSFEASTMVESGHIKTTITPTSAY